MPKNRSADKLVNSYNEIVTKRNKLLILATIFATWMNLKTSEKKARN